jgi:hypothetical protein
MDFIEIEHYKDSKKILRATILSFIYGMVIIFIGTVRG